MVSPLNRVMGNMYGREDAIRSFHCIGPEAGGCGRQINEKELVEWDRDTFFEYRQSGWCKDCQNIIFADPDFLRTRFDEYDSDMREEEPPHDMNEIDWVGNYV